MEMLYGGATMTSIVSTISAYFRTHRGNETHTYFGIVFHFTYVQKQPSKETRAMESTLYSKVA